MASAKQALPGEAEWCVQAACAWQGLLPEEPVDRLPGGDSVAEYAPKSGRPNGLDCCFAGVTGAKLTCCCCCCCWSSFCCSSLCSWPWRSVKRACEGCSRAPGTLLADSGRMADWAS
eukprot:1139743-Pelagomonas_calceolata.AAC.11